MSKNMTIKAPKKREKKKRPGDLLIKIRDKIEYDDLTAQQKEAWKLFRDWYYSEKHADSQILRIGGLSGVGKSFLLRFIIEQMDFDEEECAVVAYTGQAVNVLRQDGILAKTIHSTFMHTTDEIILNEDGRPITRSGIPLTKLNFTPVRSLPDRIKLIICDEASFLPESLQELMTKYNTPILETGDPLQLPPVAGKQCFTMDNLDYFITQIMRQNLDSEIIKLATAIRNYEPVNLADYGREVTFLWAQNDNLETFMRFMPFFRGVDLIVSSTNKQRRELTDYYRRYIIRTNSPYPQRGERLICRRNDWNMKLNQFPLTNGTIGRALYTVSGADVNTSADTFIMDFQPEFIKNDYYDGLLCDAKFLRAPFGDKDMTYYENMNPGKKFEYAHVITTQLCQGASANSVLFMDNFAHDEEYHMRLRYTAVTRARQRLYYMLPKSRYGKYTDLTSGGRSQ